VSKASAIITFLLLSGWSAHAAAQTFPAGETITATKGVDDNAAVRINSTQAVTVQNDATLYSAYGRGLWITAPQITISGNGAVTGGGSLCPGGHVDKAHDLGATGCSGIRAEASGGNILINYSGNVVATSAAFYALESKAGTITANNSGSLSGYEFGIEMSAHKGAIALTNSGSIVTHGTGILARTTGGGISVNNSGSIKLMGNAFTALNPNNAFHTLAGISVGHGGQTTIINTGSISAKRGVGILAYGKNTVVTIINCGSISGNRDAILARGKDMAVRVINYGTITGGIVGRGKGSTLAVSTPARAVASIGPAYAVGAQRQNFKSGPVAIDRKRCCQATFLSGSSCVA
jgi:hypothetical protein